MGKPDPREAVENDVETMNLEGYMANERFRMTQMTEEERQWRKQWLKDQILAPDEPRVVPELEAEIRNPIRRIYQWPLNNFLEKPLRPILGEEMAFKTRMVTGKVLMSIFVAYAFFYHMKYASGSWVRQSGWRLHCSKPKLFPGEPGYEDSVRERKPWEYNEYGFSKSPI